MYVDKDSLLLNTINIGQYLLQVEYGYNKLWGNDTGRNLNGDNEGTFIGVFPKLKLTFRDLTQTEIELLAPIFDAPQLTCTYYDPVLKRLYAMDSYTGDWATRFRNTFSNVATACESFDISVIANKRRPNV